MIFSFFKQNKQKVRDNEAVEQKITATMDDFKKNPDAWNEKLMGNEAAQQEKILSRLLLSINSERKNRVTFKHVATYAAAAVVLVGLTLGFVFKEELIYTFSSHAQITAQTSNTERKTINLPDGSVVTLNSGTKISYPDRFSPDAREVVLVDGEAYFDIKHDDKKPFQVRAGKTLTNVLGTAFNISSYSWLQTINVTVSRGKVAVNNEVLLPNEQLVYHRTLATLEKKKLLASNVISWMQGGLSFSDDDFKTVATILERKYSVKISFEDQKMENLHFSGRFEETEKLRDILDDLTATIGLQYKMDQNKITIKN